jgi:hypothetical protein
MKKLLLFLVIAGLATFAACTSGGTKTEATGDSTQVEASVDTNAVAPVADSTVK